MTLPSSPPGETKQTLYVHGLTAGLTTHAPPQRPGRFTCAVSNSPEGRLTSAPITPLRLLASSSAQRVTSAVQPVWWRGAQALAGLAVEVLVEQHQVAQVRVLGVARVVAVAGTLPVRAGQEEAQQAPAEFVARPRRASASLPDPVGHSTLEAVAVEVVVALQRLDQQVVEREPDRPAPVGVAAEEPRSRLARLVVDAVGLLPSTLEHERLSRRGRARASACRRARGTRSRRARSAARAPGAPSRGSPAGGGRRAGERSR